MNLGNEEDGAHLAVHRRLVKISVCYCELALAAVLMSEDQCVLLRAHFGRCSDLITFGTDIREDFISRTTSAGPYQNVKLIFVIRSNWE